MNDFRAVFICALVILLGNPRAYSAAEVSATPTHALMTPAEQEIRIRAKKRLYPGGKDEESLKVQAQLPTVVRRMAPTTEAPTDEPAEVTDSVND